MQIDILTPEAKLYSGEATSVKFPGIAGNFELLENHAPMIAALQKGLLIIENNNETKTIEIADGFVECIQNKISVLIADGKIS